MEFYAYYLPQYHEIEENNRWWGKGFTEWTNVKRAQKLYKKHNQPRCPLNGNYYSLDDVSTMAWQSDLAAQYGVDGFIFYHYYFKGKMLLQKPAEMLLSSDIPLGFFFCWANHTWNRAWKNSREVLMEQVYGAEEDWREHFNYLLPFFKDPRYKKIDNRPVMMIFNPDFAEKNDMMELFDALCHENGFDGIHVLESYNGILPVAEYTAKLSSVTRGVVKREPDYSLNALKNARSAMGRMFDTARRGFVELGVKSAIRKFDGNAVYKKAIEGLATQEPLEGRTVINGAFFEWDNSPRHSARGFIISPVKKELFMQYMDAVQAKGGSMVFVNAWNEWAEGMMLEPTEKEGYRYLEWIREWKNQQIGK